MNGKKRGILWIAVAALLLAGCGNALENGITQLEKKQYQEAAKSFEEVIKSGKDLGEAYHGQGLAYWELKEYGKAKESLEKALENKVQETASIYQILGNSCMELKDYEDALSYYWKGMACEGLTENQLKEMSYNEIIALEQLKDWNGAKLKIAAYVEKYPDDEDAKQEAEFLETR